MTLGYTALLSAIFLALERLNSTDRRMSPHYLANYLYLPFYLAAVYLLQAAFTPYFSWVITATGGGVLARLRTPLGEIVVTIVFALVWDLWQYWIHRWQHTSPILWESHKLHHSDTDISSSTQGRHHLLNYVLNLVCYAPILLLFGGFAPHAVGAFLMFRLWGFVNHANLRISFGPLTSVIAGPQWHRIHHSTQPEHLDKNFATFFPFIDRLFGTYYKPARNEYPPTGLVGGNSEPFVVQATVSPFLQWYRGLLRINRTHA